MATSPANYNPLYSDPAYLAFIRAGGLAEQQAIAATQNRANQINAALQAQLPAMSQNFEQQQRDLAGGLENRGMLASGEYLRRASNLGAQQGAQLASAQNGAASQIGDLNYQLALNLAQQRQNAANAALSAADRYTKAVPSGYPTP
jgi:hypothetical protein